ncbi:hypothetical protein J5N97_024865 [Dioscorea zingiberensis]|uniref:Uncharacterized protein n=1 Tax=Dioscorea zingiberensis TaxID=325984 RepID=A0A9D5C820_9LILI|nr:hypothetical protein J5N97_024865 [Dioscorea zingiberensis]
MEDGVPPPGSSLERSHSEPAAELDLMEEMLLGSSWLGTPDNSDFLQLGASNSASPLGFSPLFDISNSGLIPILGENDNQEDVQWPDFYPNPSSSEVHTGNISGMVNENQMSEPGTSLWVQPRSPFVSIRDRLNHALRWIKESSGDGNVLVQVWTPIKQGNQRVLTTHGQPFSLDPNCDRLVNYRTVSTSYQFSAEENSNVAVGLPGRVFLGKMPEWTPDVQYFSVSEYPRVGHAHQYDVRGSIALPIFEQDSRSCIGVVEMVMTSQKVNYSSDVENICKALEAVNLRSSEGLSGLGGSYRKVNDGSYHTAIPEISEVLRAVCRTHSLPLAQTWMLCIQQGKSHNRHSDGNFNNCVSTVDAACYVNDPSMLAFHKACSEHHLFKGQGVAGKAFMTNQPCFSLDITSSSRIDYPLSHHAKMFHLKAAIAIHLHCIHTGSIDFVLEFFLPIDCTGSDEQKLMLDSLSFTTKQVCQTLRVLTIKELQDEASFQSSELVPSDNFVKGSPFEVQRQKSSSIVSLVTPTTVCSGEVSSWIPNLSGTQRKEVQNVFPGGQPSEFKEDDAERFNITAYWDHAKTGLPVRPMLSEVKQHDHDSIKHNNDHKFSTTGGSSCQNIKKITEKRRAKAEKTVSLQVLRQYFAGSLKDAAKSIGVCPTTLKRICRQHGISRWPSRKIKKVGHSLRKLQVVIDSVQGAEGAFQLSSLYEDFTKASGADNMSGNKIFSTGKGKDHSDFLGTSHPKQARLSSASNSHSSSCSQSSNSSLGCIESNQRSQAVPLAIKRETLIQANPSRKLKRAQSDLVLHLATQEAPTCIKRSQSREVLGEHNSSDSLSPLHKHKSSSLRVKAIYGEEKVRFRLLLNWGFNDLKQEIARRFDIGSTSSIDLKYLDDDSEWVLLTCDADLQECLDVYKSSDINTIKISAHTTCPSTRASMVCSGS